MNVLDELVAAARERAKSLPAREPMAKPGGCRFDDALRGKDRMKVIAEFKQASPSLGDIAEVDAASQVRRYVRAGAAAVSILTEPTRFKGSFSHLEEAARAVDVPVLMKDIVIDPAQVRIAAILGARAVLLIARCLSSTELDELTDACNSYGVVPLVECHDASEVERALEIDDAVIGVNNRNLETLSVDRNLAPRLLRRIPPHRVAVAESGYQRVIDIEEIRGLADAVLIGSALMKTDDPERFIKDVVQ
jgi:indole-3-glycerol phosphate synthase